MEFYLKCLTLRTHYRTSLLSLLSFRYLTSVVISENFRPEDLGLSFFKKIVEEICTKNKIRDFDPDRPHFAWA